MNTPAITGSPLNVYIIAGESSGDLLGAHLMAAMKKLHGGQIRFSGIGGDQMAAEGLNSLFPYHELAMMGFVEILPYMFNLAARINQTVEDAMTRQPDVVITIDSPGFCFRVVDRLRKAELDSKFVHYVAPTVWAYKPKRALRCKELFDHLLVILPFEPPYFTEIGLPCTFVGHPAIAETQAGHGANFREKYAISPETPLFCLMPGSRRGEVKRHLPIFARAMTLLASQYPDLAMTVAVPRHVLAFVAPYFQNCPFRAVILADGQDKKDAIAASNVAIVKSGTVALEVAMASVPMIVTYKVHPISAWMLRRMKLTKFVNLVNILRKREVIPELLQELCTPLAIASAIAHLTSDPKAQERQKREAASALAELIPDRVETPSEYAAEVILRLL